MYKITEYSKQRAKELNVTIKPSNNKNKKTEIVYTLGIITDT